MKKIVTILLLLSIKSFSQKHAVPVGGTEPQYPLTRVIEYRGASGTTVIADTVGDCYEGAGNLKDLANATIYSRIHYNNDGTSLDVRTTQDGNNEGYLFLDGTGGASQFGSSDGINLTLLTLVPTEAVFSSMYTGFKGIEYDVTTAGYVTTNQTGKSILHRAANDLRYAPISYTATPSTTLTGDVIGVGTGTVSTTSTNSITINGSTKSIHSNPSFTINSTTSVTATSPLTVTSGSAIAIATSNSVTTGALSLTDWNTFNGKQNALSGSSSNLLSASGSSVVLGTNLSITSGTINAAGNTIISGAGCAITSNTLNIVPRVSTVTTSSLVTINVGTTDLQTITSLTTAMTFSLTGTPVSNGQGFMLRIYGASSQTLTFTTGAGQFNFSPANPAPSATSAGLYMYVYFIYNSQSGKYDTTTRDGF